MFGRSSPQPDPIRPGDNKPAAGPSGFMPASGSGAAPQQPPISGGTGSTIGPDNTVTSVIGKDLHIAGDKIIIVCESRLQVDGEIVGDLAGREVIISETASVTGSVAAESVEVLGRVNGAIRGMRVALKPSSIVEGDIVHQSLMIAEGAQFDGRVRRARDDAEVKPVLSLPKGSTA